MNILQIFVFLFSVTLCFAAVAYFPNATHPDHPNHCYYPGPPEIKLKVGETERDSSGECGIVSCSEGFTLHWASCGVVAGPDNCRIESDLSLDYPDCCPKVKCDYENMV